MSNDSRLPKLLALLESDPEDAFCLYGIAQEYAKAGQFDESLAYFDRTLAVNGDELYAYYHKARVLGSLDRADEACAVIDRGLARARAVGDTHAESELTELRASLGGS
jgi:tetratricopeptide (TPR) repeat protein